MATTRKTPSRKTAEPFPVEAGSETSAGEESPARHAKAALEEIAQAAEEAVLESVEAAAAAEGEPHSPRFHFFLIDSGWKSVSARVVRENFHMIREFQNSDPLYVLTREQSIALIRANPELIGRDPVILVHDLHAKGGKGESGYHGFRLCLGLIKSSGKALLAMQEFLRFVHNHRRNADIEKAIRQRLHRAGLEGAIEVIREGAGELME
jgi:hypothetical protein